MIGNSKRFTATIIGYAGILFLAFLKHFFPGISEAAIGIAAGLMTAYITADTVRGSKNGQK